tara:strand:+ start:180 stop:524 length:345 start_codon:yes stop_codon:yes gene_type:complete
MKDKTYSLTVDAMLQLIHESEEQASISRELILESLADREKDRRTVPLCECFSLNSKIVQILDFALRNGEIGFGEDEEEQIIFSSKDMIMLETLVLARYYMTLDLSSMNISTYFH